MDSGTMSVGAEKLLSLKFIVNEVSISLVITDFHLTDVFLPP